MLTPKSDFDHGLILIIRLLCGQLKIVDVTNIKALTALRAGGAEKHTGFKRSFRKVRRRIAAMVKKEKLKKLARYKKGTSEYGRLQRDVDHTCAKSMNDYIVMRYLVDVACILVDGNLKRADGMISRYARQWSEATIIEHVKKTYVEDVFDSFRNM